MVIQTCLMREMVRFDLNMIRSSLPKLPFLSFWKHSDTSVFPCLSCSLFAIACSPVTSVSSECCFSVAGEMSRSRRASLSASTLPFCHLQMWIIVAFTWPVSALYICVSAVCLSQSIDQLSSSFWLLPFFSRMTLQVRAPPYSPYCTGFRLTVLPQKVRLPRSSSDCRLGSWHFLFFLPSLLHVFSFSFCFCLFTSGFGLENIFLFRLPREPRRQCRPSEPPVQHNLE